MDLDSSDILRRIDSRLDPNLSDSVTAKIFTDAQFAQRCRFGRFTTLFKISLSKTKIQT